MALLSPGPAYAPLHSDTRELGLMDTHCQPACGETRRISHCTSGLIDVLFIHWTLGMVKAFPTLMEPQYKRVYKLGERVGGTSSYHRPG